MSYSNNWLQNIRWPFKRQQFSWYSTKSVKIEHKNLWSKFFLQNESTSMKVSSKDRALTTMETSNIVPAIPRMSAKCAKPGHPCFSQSLLVKADEAAGEGLEGCGRMTEGTILSRILIGQHQATLSPNALCHRGPAPESKGLMTMIPMDTEDCSTTTSSSSSPSSGQHPASNPSDVTASSRRGPPLLAFSEVAKTLLHQDGQWRLVKVVVDTAVNSGPKMSSMGDDPLVNLAKPLGSNTGSHCSLSWRAGSWGKGANDNNPDGQKTLLTIGILSIIYLPLVSNRHQTHTWWRCVFIKWSSIAGLCWGGRGGQSFHLYLRILPPSSCCHLVLFFFFSLGSIFNFDEYKVGCTRNYKRDYLIGDHNTAVAQLVGVCFFSFYYRCDLLHIHPKQTPSQTGHDDSCISLVACSVVVSQLKYLSLQLLVQANFQSCNFFDVICVELSE